MRGRVMATDSSDTLSDELNWLQLQLDGCKRLDPSLRGRLNELKKRVKAVAAVDVVRNVLSENAATPAQPKKEAHDLSFSSSVGSSRSPSSVFSLSPATPEQSNEAELEELRATNRKLENGEAYALKNSRDPVIFSVFLRVLNLAVILSLREEWNQNAAELQEVICEMRASAHLAGHRSLSDGLPQEAIAQRAIEAESIPAAREQQPP